MGQIATRNGEVGAGRRGNWGWGGSLCQGLTGIAPAADERSGGAWSQQSEAPLVHHGTICHSRIHTSEGLAASCISQGAIQDCWRQSVHSARLPFSRVRL